MALAKDGTANLWAPPTPLSNCQAVSNPAPGIEVGGKDQGEPKSEDADHNIKLKLEPIQLSWLSLQLQVIFCTKALCLIRIVFAQAFTGFLAMWNGSWPKDGHSESAKGHVHTLNCPIY